MLHTAELVDVAANAGTFHFQHADIHMACLQYVETTFRETHTIMSRQTIRATVKLNVNVTHLELGGSDLNSCTSPLIRRRS